MRLFILVIFVISAVRGTAIAEPWYEMEDPELATGPINVPERLKSRGYTLRAGAASYELDELTQIVPKGAWSSPRDIELVAKDGRILDYQFAHLNQDVLNELFPQLFDVSLVLGLNMARKKDWKPLNLSGMRQVLGVVAAYRPSAFRHQLAFMRLRDSSSDDQQAIVEYQNKQWRVASGYELNLAPYVGPKWRRLSLAFVAGVTLSHHKLSVYRGDESLKPMLSAIENSRRESEFSRSAGSFVAAKLQHTLINNVWLVFDWGLMFDNFSFDDAATTHRRPQQELKAHLRFSF